MYLNYTQSSFYSGITPSLAFIIQQTAVPGNVIMGKNSGELVTPAEAAHRLYLLSRYHISLTKSYLPLGTGNFL